MAKISVRHGIARAYGFLFGRLFQIVGLSWLPAVLYAVTATYLLQRVSGAMQTAVPSAASLLGEYPFFFLLALVVVTAFLGAVIAVPLTKDALGQREEAAAVHFVVGAREARLFFALLRFYAVEMIVLLALVVVAGIAVTYTARYAMTNNLHLDWAGLHFQTWLNVGAGAIGAIVFLLIATKLGFLVTPVAAFEKHAKLTRAAQLSRGNFWRLAFIYAAVGVPATLVLLACETSLGGLEIGKTLPKGMQAFYTVAPDHIAVFAAIMAGGLVVLHALFAGAAAAAYEELADASVYEHAPEVEPVMSMPRPAMAFADARAQDTHDMRPGDQRSSMMREDLASQAASDVAPVVMAEAPMAQPEYAAPLDNSDLREIVHAGPVGEPVHDAVVTQEVVEPHAEQPYAEEAPMAVAEHVETVAEAEPVMHAEEAAPVIHEADASQEIHAEQPHAEEPALEHLPSLDPAAMANAPHADVSEPVA